MNIPEPILTGFCSRFSITRDHLSYLGGGQESSDGTTFSFPFESRERVLKVMELLPSDPDKLLCLQERLKFARFLGEQGVDIVFPIPLGDGALLATVQGDHTGWVGYIMEKVEGHHPERPDFTPTFYHRFGATIGRLHRISQEYPSWQCSLVDGKSVLGWELEWQGFYNWCQDGEIKAHWLKIRERLEKLPVERSGFGFTHNDTHIQNLLLTGDPGDGGRIVLIDFDVANYMWFINDIVVAMQALLFFATGGMERPLEDAGILHFFLHHFMQGYETENHLDPAWLEKIDLFIEYRRILLFTVMQGWLSTQPEKYAQWKKMILEDPPVLNGN
jgi:amicoumacin kinase